MAPSRRGLTDRTSPRKPLRLALLTTGLRPVGLGFPDFPQKPVGIVSWDLPQPTGWQHAMQTTPVISDAIARARGKPYASLERLCARNGLQYAAIDKRQPDELTALFARWKIDLVITNGCAIVPMETLAGVPLGGINLHSALLPRWRGADPLFWQIATGESPLGVSVHRLAAGSDTGAMLASKPVERPRGFSLARLVQLLEHEAGVPLLRDVIERIANAEQEEQAQTIDSPTPYATRIKFEQIARVFPRHALGDQEAADLVAFLGRSPW